nr:hypothetical protein [Tanacetum cinerariifolium]
MRTRNSYFPNNSSVTILRRRNKRCASNIVEPELHTIVEVAPMADNRTMEELLQAPTEGYGEAIVIPEINAGHFKIKTNLLQLGEMKAITTRSGVAYEGPSIPTKPSLKKVVEQETDETTNNEQTNFQESIAHIQPPVIPILEPDVPKTLPKPNIPYPSRLNDQKLREKATNQMEKLRPEPITDVKLHPNIKPAVLIVFRANDKRNFQVHNPFKFIDFGVTKLDELGPIIQKKKNTIVKDLMTSLGKRHERLKKIPKELGIQSALPAPVPKQAPSESSGRKRKHIELEPKIKKEDKIKKAIEEAKMLEMTRTEVIKVVQEEAEKIRLDPKTIIKVKKHVRNSRNLKMLNIKSLKESTLKKPKEKWSSGRKGSVILGYMIQGFLRLIRKKELPEVVMKEE